MSSKHYHLALLIIVSAFWIWSGVGVSDTRLAWVSGVLMGSIAAISLLTKLHNKCLSPIFERSVKTSVINCACSILVFLFALGIAACGKQTSTDTKAPVDKTLTRSIDVNGDGVTELIILNFQGNNWRAPFKWTLTVKAKDETIFAHTSDDAGLDSFFADKGYVDNCTDYLSCKKKYYEKDLLMTVVDNPAPSPDSGIFDKDSGGSIRAVAQQELMGKYHLSEGKASEIIDLMIGRLQNGTIPTLSVPVSPVENSFPIMYVKEVGGFVTVYKW